MRVFQLIRIIIVKVLSLVHRIRLSLARGWKKVYLSYLTPPSNEDACYSWLNLDVFCDTLREKHSDLLTFPGARQFYMIDYMLDAFLLGIRDESYFRLLHYKNGWKERNKTITNRRLDFIRDQLNSAEEWAYLDDKLLFAAHWKEFFNRIYCSTRDPGFTKESFLELFRDCKRIIIKPAEGSRGAGIRIMDVCGNLDEIYEELRQLPEEYIVEEYVFQTGMLHELNPTSLNTVRVVTLRSHDCTEVVAATLRVGGKGAVIDNLHGGGAGFTVHPRDGRIYNGVFTTGLECTAHPDTGLEITGRTVPRWDEVTEFCRAAHAIAPRGLNFIGWDVCISDDKLCMIEGNAIPGTPPCVADQDHWKMISKFFDEHPELPLTPKQHQQ